MVVFVSRNLRRHFDCLNFKAFWILCVSGICRSTDAVGAQDTIFDIG